MTGDIPNRSRDPRPTVFASLGYGVLVTAMVETAAFCLVKCRETVCP